MNENILEISSISYSVPTEEGKTHKILDNINLNLRKGEIVAILGKSGCGKSTLLRIISGLIQPTKGKVKLLAKNDAHTFGMSMIFQNFALFPWLSVLENVELGLEAMGLDAHARRKRALAAIDLIGLDGFESAMPRELSGGMKQRVGFARALVVEPAVLLMDEPFSALDILTSDTLKQDFLALWQSKQTPLESVIIVTHSIEEAVLMADRIIILSANPGRVMTEVRVDMPRPRDTQLKEFHALVDHIYAKMADTLKYVLDGKKKKPTEDDITHNLLLASPNQLAAATHALIAEPYKGQGDLADLVRTLHLKTLDVLHIAETLAMLKFATTKDGKIKLNKDGKEFAQGTTAVRKKIFAEHLLENVPLATYIIKVLNDRSDHTAPLARFMTHLEDHMAHDQAQVIMNNIIAAGRYAEIFAYDANSKLFSLDNP